VGIFSGEVLELQIGVGNRHAYPWLCDNLSEEMDVNSKKINAAESTDQPG
jgi:hypothetical protein